MTTECSGPAGSLVSLTKVIELRLDVDTLGRTRFGYSPMAELACSVRALGAPSVGHVLRPWLQETLCRLDRVDLDLLRAVAPPGHVAADFLFPWSVDPKITIDRQLTALAGSAPERLWADLKMVWGGDGRMPASLVRLREEGAAGCRHLADVLSEYWAIAIEPYWYRIRAVIDDDVAYRAGRVLAGGLYELLSDLHPEVTLRDQALLIDKPQHADATYSDATLTLVPSVFVWPNLMVGQDERGQVDMTFPARGVGRVWEGLSSVESAEPAESEGDALGALVGRARAAILARLDVPMTTTALARELGQSAGTVSTHLSILRACGLLTSWRAGRSVLYRRTPLAASVLAASGSPISDEQLA